MMNDSKYLSEWETSSTFSKWTFRVVLDMLTRGEHHVLDYVDLTLLPSTNRSKFLTVKLEESYILSRKFLFLPRFIVALLKSQWQTILVIHFYAILEGATRIASPVVLRSLLQTLQESNPSQPFIWAGVLSALNIFQAIIHHILFFYSMQLGWNWKAASTAVIYNKLFRFKMDALGTPSVATGITKEGMALGTGKLVNLISNDVARFEDFSIFLCFFGVSFLELAAVLIVLILYLDIGSGFAGVGSTILCIPVQLYLAKKFAQLRTSTAQATDRRVRLISQVIDGITTVKSYGWQKPFYLFISTFRSQETHNINQSQKLRSVNLALYFFVPTLSTFATFSVYMSIAKNPKLNLPLVFSVMSLLLQLRMTIGRQWTRSIETGSEAIASAHRIEQFLNLPDDTDISITSHHSQTPQNIKELERYNLAVNTETYLSENSPFQSCDPSTELPLVTDADTKEDGVSSSFSLSDSLLLKLYKSDYCHTTESTSDSSVFILKDIELELHAGELLLVVGPVGSGKSSVLSALLGDLRSSSSKGNNVTRYLKPGVRFSYCVQQPWILASSVKSNIVFAGVDSLKDALLQENVNDDVNTAESAVALDSYKSPLHVNERLYDLAKTSANLSRDIAMWPHGDETEIGERGISISGGQKARVALARAIYSDADVNILDDVLSAVDAEVGRRIFFDCIFKALKGRNKSVVLATHQQQYLSQADKILALDSTGRQVFFGSYHDLLLASQATDASEYLSSLVSSVSSASINDESDEKLVANIENITPSKLDPTNNLHKDKSGDNKVVPVNQVSVVPSVSQMYGIQKEDRAEGRISVQIVLNYLFSGGIWKGILAFSVALLSQGVIMVADYWPQWWAVSQFGDQSNRRYIWIYGILTLLSIYLGFIRATLWFRFTLNAARSLHERALWSVLHAPLAFFHANPSGRILNRFTRDQNQADELLPYTMFDCLQCIFFCLAALLLVCITVPYLLLLMPVLAYCFAYVRARYITSSRELKRLEATTRSPIFADFSATLDGLTTLKAYSLRRKATESFQRLIDRNSRVWFAFLLVSRWLGFRLDMQSALVLMAVAFVSVGLKDSVNVGLLGFTLTYTLALSGLLQWAARQSAEVENMLTSVERISAYSLLAAEVGYTSTRPVLNYDNGDGDPCLSPVKISKILDNQEAPSSENDSRDSKDKIMRGELRIIDLFVSYREDMTPVLRNINLHIPAGSRVGVCGRTGSGKSSLLLSLLRLNVIRSGDILLDGQSLISTSLENAREIVTSIPQTPDLFSGTVRFNLDPFRQYSDLTIWDALKAAHMGDHIRRNPRGLEASVEEGGRNFSVGQRQLLNLARAILRRSPLVLLDEVTASVDYATDRLLQETIRQSPSFAFSTVITIAHRLRTIADNNLIVVIRDGEVAEVGSPKELLQKASLFRVLAIESNEFNDICKLAGLESVLAL